MNKSANQGNNVDDINNPTIDDEHVSLNACKESITLFLVENENMENIESTNNNFTSVENSNQCRKRLFGGPPEETMFTLSHSLRCFSNLLLTCS